MALFLARLAPVSAETRVPEARAFCASNQALPFNLFVFSLFADSAFLALARFAIGITVRRTQEQVASGEQSKTCATRAGRGLTIIFALIIALMFVVSIESAFTQEITAGAVATWLFFAAISILSNVRALRDIVLIVKNLIQARKRLGLRGQQVQDRNAFSRRIVIWLLTAYLLLLCQLIVVCVQNLSPMHFLVAYVCQMLSSATQATAALNLLRNKPSLIASCWMFPTCHRRIAEATPQQLF